MAKNDPHELVLVVDKITGAKYPVKRLVATADTDRYTVTDGPARDPQGFPVKPVPADPKTTKAATPAATKNA